MRGRFHVMAIYTFVRLSDRLFASSFICSFVCRLWYLLSHSLRGSTWRRVRTYRYTNILWNAVFKTDECDVSWQLVIVNSSVNIAYYVRHLPRTELVQVTTSFCRWPRCRLSTDSSHGRYVLRRQNGRRRQTVDPQMSIRCYRSLNSAQLNLFVIKTQDNKAEFQHLPLPQKKTQMTNIKL